MTETISTGSYERHVRISSRYNTDTGDIEELHARITGKAVTLTRVSTVRKPKSFWISEEEINMLVAEQTAYLYWLKRRDETLKEAKALVNRFEMKPGDIVFQEEYGEAQESYEIYRVEGWGKDNTYHQHETIWQHVLLEDLVEQIKDAQQWVAEQGAVQGKMEGLDPLEIVDDEVYGVSPIEVAKEYLKRNE